MPTDHHNSTSFAEHIVLSPPSSTLGQCNVKNTSALTTD
jgi:hypothetical protein